MVRHVAASLRSRADVADRRPHQPPRQGQIDARALLTEAESEFASFGATAWQAQAAAELARVNVRPAAPAELTETERLVAQLAASGLSNREVADRTFLAVKTVEANLARVLPQARDPFARRARRTDGR